MKLVRVALGALSSFVLAMSSALAADPVSVSSPVWGAYVGGGFCYDRADINGEYLLQNDPHEIRGDADAPCVALTTGIDRQLESFLVGFEVSADLQRKVGRSNVASFMIGDIFSVTGRAGLLATPEVLFYALAGWSWGRDGNLGGTTEIFHDLNGPTFGAGIETLMARNWSTRIEGRVVSFGDQSVLGGSANITDKSIRLLLLYRP